jgi:hypothetical protein
MPKGRMLRPKVTSMHRPGDPGTFDRVARPKVTPIRRRCSHVTFGRGCEFDTPPQAGIHPFWLPTPFLRKYD